MGEGREDPSQYTDIFVYPDTLETKSPGRFKDFTVVVLINKLSASASEIFAGRMKEWGHAILGEQSLGKGVVQTMYRTGLADDESRFALTTSEYFIGNNFTPIHEQGVTPTTYVPDCRLSDTFYVLGDCQLNAAIEMLEALEER